MARTHVKVVTANETNEFERQLEGYLSRGWTLAAYACADHDSRTDAFSYWYSAVIIFVSEDAVT